MTRAMQVYNVILAVLLFSSAVFAATLERHRVSELMDAGGPGGGGGGGAGNEEGPGENGSPGGGEGGGEGGQGGWGGPVSNGTDAECTDIAAERCPTDQLLPDVFDCGAFCMCHALVGKFMPCPGGLHFSEKLQLCTWPDSANCTFPYEP